MTCVSMWNHEAVTTCSHLRGLTVYHNIIFFPVELVKTGEVPKFYINIYLNSLTSHSTLTAVGCHVFTPQSHCSTWKDKQSKFRHIRWIATLHKQARILFPVMNEYDERLSRLNIEGMSVHLEVLCLQYVWKVKHSNEPRLHYPRMLHMSWQMWKSQQ